MQIRKGTGFRCLNLDANGVDTPGVMGCFTPDRPTQVWRTRSGPMFCSQFDVTAVCASYNPPLQGLFGTWRQYPTTFTDFRAAQIAQYLGGRTVNAQLSDAVADWFEIGWRSVHTPATASSPPVIAKEAYWHEKAPGVYRYHSLAQLPDGATANGQTHTYMALASTTGKIDLLYDYNTVGTTTASESGRISFVETGLSHSDQGTARIPSQIEHRIQTLDASGIWRRPPAADMSLYESRPCNGPSWGSPYTAPACLNGAVTVRPPTEMEFFTVTQPAAPVPVATPLAAPRRTADPQAVLNGVDQRHLSACMEQSPGDCLATVPGLAQCVAERRQCRSWTNGEQATTMLRAAPMSVTEAVTAARQTLRTERNRPLPATVRPVTRTVAAGNYASGALLKTGLDPTENLIVVTAKTRVRALEHSASAADKSYQGFTLTYRAATGTLLHACLGTSCGPVR